MASIDAGEPVLAKFVKCFVKFEGGHNRPTKARAIQMYKNLATQNRYAARFYCLQKAFGECIGLDGFGRDLCLGLFGQDITLTFASGLTPQALGRWMDRIADRAKAFYERDGKNWDATMQTAHIEQRLRFYRAIDSELADFAGECANVRGGMKIHGVGSIQYTAVGTTKSGHNDTSLGNSITNLCLALETMLEHGVGGDVIAMGDDLLAGVSSDFSIDAFTEYERGLGIKPEARKFYGPEQVSFVSGCFAPVLAGGSYTFLPVPGRILTRLFWTTNPPGRKKQRAWRTTVAKGMQHLFRGVPLMMAFLDSQVTGDRINTRVLSRDQNRRHQLAVKAAQDPGGGAVPGLADAWMCARYGFSGRELDDLRCYLGSRPQGPSVMEHYLLDRMVQVDLVDIAVRSW
jgi:hypothetical protein